MIYLGTKHRFQKPVDKSDEKTNKNSDDKEQNSIQYISILKCFFEFAPYTPDFITIHGTQNQYPTWPNNLQYSYFSNTDPIS